jgi:hypothetical protein
MPTRYPFHKFLRTSETIEFILDFSTGLVTGVDSSADEISRD